MIKTKEVLPAARAMRPTWGAKIEPELNSGCHLWAGTANPGGYGLVRFKRHNLMAHRVAYAIRHDRDPGDLWILHSCDTPACVNPDHLRAGTCAENVMDARLRCRWGKGGQSTRNGDGNPKAKLTAEQVLEIFLCTFDISGLPAKYGCKSGAIDDIRNRRTWKSVTAGFKKGKATRR